jgi:hypothetical protein
MSVLAKIQPKKNKKSSSAVKSVSKVKVFSHGVTAATRFELPPLTTLQLSNQMRQPVTVCFSKTAVRKCFGCNKPMNSSKTKPDNVIFRKLDSRQYQHEGVWYRRDELANTYYHFSMKCIQINYPYLSTPDIVLYDDIRQQLSTEHIKQLHEIGVHNACSHE